LEDLIIALTEAIDGSSFVGCPLVEIGLARGSQPFMIQRNFLPTSDGAEIVRYIGRESRVVVLKKVERWEKSCFEASNQLERLLFENESNLRRIGRAALHSCVSPKSILIPASVEIIEEEAFKGCSELLSCSIAQNANLSRTEKEAFSGCHSLKSFLCPEVSK
jgi:hypothetical protein